MAALIELDERRRVSLGKVGRREHTRYLAEEEPDGTIILRPAVVLTEAQAQLLQRRDVSDAIDEFLSDPQNRGVRRGRPRRK